MCEARRVDRFRENCCFQGGKAGTGSGLTHYGVTRRAVAIPRRRGTHASVARTANTSEPMRSREAAKFVAAVSDVQAVLASVDSGADMTRYRHVCSQTPVWIRVAD